MLLSFFLLFFLCESTVKSQTMSLATSPTTGLITSTEAQPSPLQLVAIPDHPVAAGQHVVLHCGGFTISDGVTGSWQHLEDQTWRDMGDSSTDLTLTEPEHSGLYRCSAGSQLSQNHTVYIVSMHATVGENLGIAAFALSLLALIINIAILVWLGWQRLTTSNTAAEGFPAPEKSPKGGLPQTESDGGMYMNYTNTSPSYSDLDPSMKEDNVYSSLS
ncbi:uncharacterized protein LOC141783525 [Sebastes fasciatus]|uniref:uncharacterized protein LOC141783525 n=1 Tax=Sebastes fasciatus TaxID=394691 RepID=UPI003D9ECC78